MLNLSFSIDLAISLGLKASLWWNIILGNTMASTCMRLKQVQAIKISTEFYIQQYISMPAVQPPASPPKKCDVYNKVCHPCQLV